MVAVMPGMAPKMMPMTTPNRATAMYSGPITKGSSNPMNHTSLSLVENEAQGRNLNGEETGGQGDGERGAEHNADDQAGHHGDDQAGDVVPGVFSCALLANRVLNRNRQMMDQKVKPSLSSRKK